jgi:hypothetical protein
MYTSLLTFSHCHTGALQPTATVQEALHRLLQMQRFRCAINACTLTPKKRQFNTMSFDAIVPGLPHSADNIQWVCLRVNMGKHVFKDNDFAAILLLVRTREGNDKSMLVNITCKDIKGQIGLRELFPGEILLKAFSLTHAAICADLANARKTKAGGGVAAAALELPSKAAPEPKSAKEGGAAVAARILWIKCKNCAIFVLTPPAGEHSSVPGLHKLLVEATGPGQSLGWEDPM